MGEQIQNYKWLQCKIFKHMQDTLQTLKTFFTGVRTFSNLHDCNFVNITKANFQVHKYRENVNPISSLWQPNKQRGLIQQFFNFEKVKNNNFVTN